MRLATFISWLLTVGIGAFMLRTWLARGGLDRERGRDGGLPPQMIFSHAGLAVAGLLAWTAYLAGAAKPLAWTAVGMLTLAVGLGLCTVTIWTPYPARRPGERRARAPSDGPEAAVPDTPAGAAVPDTPAGAADPPDSVVTDEMISRLLAVPVRPGRYPRGRPNPAVLVPVAHGLAAMSTCLLAVMTAST